MKPAKFLDDPRKRKLLLASAASIAAAGLGTYLYASLVEARRYRLDAVRVNTGDPAIGSGEEPSSIEGKAFAGGAEDGEALRLRILHLSDLHLCFPESHKIDFLKRATDANFDLIVITGDIFENYSGICYADKIISRAPRLGTFAVLGNHDYYDYNMLHRTIGRFFRKWRSPKAFRDVTPMVEALEKAGINVLRNSAQNFSADKIKILGLDYPGGIRKDRLSELLADTPDDHLVLALMHVPERLDLLSQAGVDLAFGGHTHGGQVRIPFFGPLITNSELPRHEASGLIWRGATAIHVSRGVGADPRSNFRLFCPPHGSIIEVCHRRQ